MENLVIILKGFILGIANVIPGVSGGTLAITLGIYERLLSVINHFKDKLKENIKFILFLLIGIVIAILVFSNIIGFCLEKYPFATILFFIGIILGGLPTLFKKVKNTVNLSNLIIFFITFGIVMILTFIRPDNNEVSLDSLNIVKIIGLFFSGAIASASMLLPGISGSFVLMLFGYYKPIINSIRELTKFNNLMHNIIVLGFAGIGILLGIFIAARLIEWLLKKYEVKTYYGIIGFVIASIISIFITAVSNPIGTIEIIVGILLLLTGILVAKFVGE